MALFHYHDIATARNQHQLREPAKLLNDIHYYFKKLLFSNYHQNLTKCNILSNFAFKNYGKFSYYNVEKLCPWFLASRRSVLEKAVLWLEFFLDLGLDLGLEGSVFESNSGNELCIDVSLECQWEVARVQ